MVYTISLPNGVKFSDNWSFVRLLRLDGVDLMNMPRVADPNGSHRWLYAWRDRDEAEAFAVRLREASEYDAWQVVGVEEAELSQGPVGPVEICMSRQSDGCTYGIDPLSRRLILQRFPEAKLTDNVFISLPKTADLYEHQADYWEYVTHILTGIPPAQLAELGGYRIFDPVELTVFRESPIFVKTAQAEPVSLS